MKSKCLLFVLGLAVFSGTPVFSQIFKTRVLAEAESLRVLGADAFPKDLACEVYIGPKQFPSFTTEGAHGRLNTATIDINLDSSVSVFRRDTEKDSWVLVFLSEDKDKKVFALFDLNCDGKWDVKKTPTREKRNFVSLGNEWFEVDKVDGLQSVKPTAARGERQFEFRRGMWKLVQKTLQ